MDLLSQLIWNKELIGWLISISLTFSKPALKQSSSTFLKGKPTVPRPIQSIIYDALHNEELDIFKKANLALRFLSLMRGKDDILQKDTEKLRKHLDYKEFNFGII